MPEVSGPVAKFCWSLTFGWRSSKTAGGGLGDETTIKWGFRPAQTVLPKRALLREGAVKGACLLRGGWHGVQERPEAFPVRDGVT